VNNKVVYPVPATGTRSPRITYWQLAINNSLVPKPTPKPNPNPTLNPTYPTQTLTITITKLLVAKKEETR